MDPLDSGEKFSGLGRAFISLKKSWFGDNLALVDMGGDLINIT